MTLLALAPSIRLAVRPRVRPSRHLLVLWGAVLVAILLRVLWIIRADTYPAPLMDQGFYDEVARRLAAGLGYTASDGSPTATFPPGYPLLLAAVYRLFGPSLAAAQALNVVLAVGAVMATYLLGQLVVGRTVALAGAWLLALLPGQVLWSSLVMSELPFTLALIGSLTLFLRGVFPVGGATRPLSPGMCPPPPLPLHRWRAQAGATVPHRRAAWWRSPFALHPWPATATMRRETALVLVAGLLGGYAALTRGQAVGLPVVLLVWAFWLRVPAAGRAAMLYAIAFALVLLPWGVRNATRIDRSVLLSSNAGWNAVIGHHDQANGGFWSPLYGHAFDRYLALPPVEREAAMHREGLRMARHWALRNPVREGELALLKVRRLWTPSADAVRWQESAGVEPFLRSGERTALTWLVAGSAALVLLLALPSVVVGVRRREPFVLLVIVLSLYWTAFHVLFFAEGRYLYPLLPLFCLMAASTLRHGWVTVRARYAR